MTGCYRFILFGASVCKRCYKPEDSFLVKVFLIQFSLENRMWSIFIDVIIELEII